ncbi:MAG: GGDEF domain-containing protein [Firmicutes bacterium]|nr:GGDEF domain-containing protein [Bacillota bacterium]
MADTSRSTIKGVRLKVISIITAAFVAVSSLALIYVSHVYSETQNSFHEEEMMMAECLQSCRDLQSASDYLTDAARSFVVTGSPDYVAQYVQEIETDRRREAAIDDIRERLGDTEVAQTLEEALEASVALQEAEYYAIRLKIESSGVDLRSFPEVFQSIELSEWDANAKADSQLAVAQKMLFSDDYHKAKDVISGKVDKSIDLITQSMVRNREENAASLTNMHGLQYILIVFVLVFSMALMALLHPLVISPLENAVKSIKHTQSMPLKGSYEVRYVAASFNDLFEKVMKQSSELKFEAEHDPLTGLYNRGAFTRLCGELEGTGYTLILVDVDKFKTINDTYGHDVGDIVLKRFAHGLTDIFREDDLVFRIGGDEFAVILKSNEDVLRNAISAKISHLNSILERGGNRRGSNLPGFTISVGVAFSRPEEDSDTVFKHADSALYEVKRGARRGCAFYSEEV